MMTLLHWYNHVSSFLVLFFLNMLWWLWSGTSAGKAEDDGRESLLFAFQLWRQLISCMEEPRKWEMLTADELGLGKLHFMTEREWLRL